MRKLPDTAPAQFGAFDVRTARGAGWTMSALAHAVRSGRVIRVTRGWYVPTETWEGNEPEDRRRRLFVRALAAVATISSAVASHASAAVLAGLPIWSLPESACVTVPPMRTAEAACAHVHRAGIGSADIVTDGIALRTTSARTVADLAREHGVEDAVVAGDAALHERMTDVARLTTVIAGCQGWPGVRRARDVLDLLDGRAESPAESVSRLRLRGWDLPPPELQTTITDRSGRFLGRLDFYWPEFGVGGEVDGRAKYATAPDEVFFREKRRQELLEDTGLGIVRWGVADLAAGSVLPRRLRSAFTRGAWLPAEERRWRAVPAQRATSPGLAAGVG